MLSCKVIAPHLVAAADGSQQRSAQAQEGHASNGGAPYANGVTGLNGLDHTTDDGGSDASQQSPAKQKNKKQKAPKVRKPTPASAAAQLKLDAVAQVSCRLRHVVIFYYLCHVARRILLMHARAHQVMSDWRGTDSASTASLSRHGTCRHRKH